MLAGQVAPRGLEAGALPAIGRRGQSTTTRDGCRSVCGVEAVAARGRRDPARSAGGTTTVSVPGGSSGARASRHRSTRAVERRRAGLAKRTGRGDRAPRSSRPRRRAGGLRLRLRSCGPSRRRCGDRSPDRSGGASSGRARRRAPKTTRAPPRRRAGSRRGRGAPLAALEPSRPLVDAQHRLMRGRSQTAGSAAGGDIRPGPTVRRGHVRPAGSMAASSHSRRPWRST